MSILGLLFNNWSFPQENNLKFIHKVRDQERQAKFNILYHFLKFVETWFSSNLVRLLGIVISGFLYLFCVNGTLYGKYTSLMYNSWKTTQAKKKCVFPIAWSSKLGSVGRDFFFFFFFFINLQSMLLPLKSHTHLFVPFLLQLINYLTCSTMFLVSNIDQMYKEMNKIQTGNRSLINPFQLNVYQKASISQQSSVYCWSRRQISGFCRSFFLLYTKCWGRSETHIFLFYFFGLCWNQPKLYILFYRY